MKTTSTFTVNTASQLPTVKKLPTRPYDSMDNKWRGYRYIWEVYPEVWSTSWGNKPLLGYVRADSEFNAYYSAFDKELGMSWNFPFGVTVNKATKFVKGI